MELRYYQEDAVQSLFDYFEKKKGNPLLALPTGSGKSVILGEFVKRALYMHPDTKIMMLVHRKKLIEQNFKKLKELWPQAPCGIYSAGLKTKQYNFPITFGGVASVANAKLEEFGCIDLVIVDEAHLVSRKENTMYQKILGKLKEKNQYLKVIGLTATHYRLDSGLLTEKGGIFTDLCYDLTRLDKFNKLIEEGYLCPLVPKKPNFEYDLSEVRTTAGEFNGGDLEKATNVDELTKKAVSECMVLASNRKHWLVFSSGIGHTESVCAEMNSRGIKTAMVHSGLLDEENDKVIEDFKAGVYRAVVNCNILTTGFDFPAIDFIAAFTATKSASLWVQMCGRGTRPAPGKADCLVADFGGNTRRLGPINDPVIPRKNAKGKSLAGVAPVKICVKCGTYCHASVSKCPSCGEEFPKNQRLDALASTDELIRTEYINIETFKVDQIHYDSYRNERKGTPECMRVTYYCGLKAFQEYICPEHTGYAKVKAFEWLRCRITDSAAVTTKEFVELGRKGAFLEPKQLKVHVNKKPYPQITDYIYHD